MAKPNPSKLIVGIDTGGTFTDIVAIKGRRSFRIKLLSTPRDPSVAVIGGLRRLFPDEAPDRLTYGTTVATNAMLQRRGARIALITNKGFEDVIEIGRQARPSLYSLEPRKPAPLVGRPLRFGLGERTLFDGRVEQTPEQAELDALGERIKRAGVKSIAVCLLHAGANPNSERIVATAVAGLGLPVTLSHQLSPQAGEFERTSTVVANAYVRPLMEQHIGKLKSEAKAGQFRVMQSNGGCIGAATAAAEPVRTMLSGPAGGVAAAMTCVARLGIKRAITFDMGGTSTDVALLAGELPRRSHTDVGSIPVRTPCLDIHTVGAGGGSIALIDAGGSLKVGPQSAGAVPGPACYGQGSAVTVTDANLVLGRLRPNYFLGGTMQLASSRAQKALDALARRAKTPNSAELAAGVVEVVEANMERAVRLITVERGEDPRDCTLVCFGGAAALHGCGLADKLGLDEVLIPADPGLFSARGVMQGRLVRDLRLALRVGDPDFAQLTTAVAGAVAQTQSALHDQGLSPAQIKTETFVSLRYLGQSIELEVPLTRGFRAAFDALHERLLHTQAPDRSVECCGARVTSTEKIRAQRKPAGTTVPRGHKRAEPIEIADVYVDGRSRRVPVFDRESLTPGFRTNQPAIIVEYSSTVFLDAGWKLRVDADHNLRLLRSTKAKA